MIPVDFYLKIFLVQITFLGGPILRTRRHVTTTPYPNDRRTQDRSRKRPCRFYFSSKYFQINNLGQKPDGSGSGLTTLEIRKIPVESNTISKLNEHFSKFGTVTNVQVFSSSKIQQIFHLFFLQIAFDGSPDSALVAYSTFQEAETAYRNPEPLFNNRFIKIFWHNPNKTTEKNNSPSDVSSTKKPITTPNPMKHHWTKTQKPSQNKNEVKFCFQSFINLIYLFQTSSKKKSTIPPGPSIIKKEAAKKAAIEIRRKKYGLLEEQIQQQKLLLKKLEAAETNEEKESIRSLMKQVDSTVRLLKDSIRTIPIKLSSSSSSSITKISQQDLLKQRAEILKKQIESLRAKTSADMVRFFFKFSFILCSILASCNE